MVWQKSQQTDWLSLVEISGPFLAVSVLEKIFPQGLEKVSTLVRRRLRSAYEEWLDAIDEDDPLLAELHKEWIRLVLFELLDFEEAVLLVNQDLETPFTYSPPEHTGSFSPDFVVPGNQADAPPRLLISVLDPERDLESVKSGDGWPASVVERMVGLCRSLNTRIGLITNGERWLLVNAPVGSTTGHTSWYARIWFQEAVTLQAFQSLFGVRRWFGPEEENLPALLEKSLEEHEEITDTLGEQVRQAVEVLVQSLDKADQDRNRELLGDVSPEELYEAGLTVMMRLVFILCAEERELLLLGDPVYDQHYAVTTLRAQLAEEADLHGHEILERRHDAWARLLAVFRAVYGGIEHETLRMPALGGSLFDPDRFPFLEGRSPETRWRETAAHPLPIDNRTVLLLLTALQVLEQKNGALLLSYKALDVEQIGHIYEGLLELTVRRLPKDTIGLAGTKKAKNPNITLAELESALLDGVDGLAKLIKKITQKGLPAIKNVLKKDVTRATFAKVVTACGGDTELAKRVRPYSNLLRTDAWGDFIVYKARSFAVTLGADRRETGTHYTPKSLTESIVETTLEPIAYIGSAEGKPREEWQLKPASELLELKICDPAMGSGAFLVQVCRWLSERVVEVWRTEKDNGNFITVDGVVLTEAGRAEPMPESMDDQLLIARRLIAEKCLYGVDLNPLAVELAKLSIWLITLAKGRPFGFLDHNLRSGDSLLGIHRLDQLTKFTMNPESSDNRALGAKEIESVVADVLKIRRKIRETPIRDIRDIENMERLNKEAENKLRTIEIIADAMIGCVLVSGGKVRELNSQLKMLSVYAGKVLEGNVEVKERLRNQAQQFLSVGFPEGKKRRMPFHWVLEFPEVFDNGGFDGVIGNPPFMFGKNISSKLGINYNSFLILQNPAATKNVDICAHFLTKAFQLTDNAGAIGMLSTSSIAEGETRVAGLGSIIELGGKIFSAKSKLRWPGTANVFVSQIHLIRGWQASCCLDGKEQAEISSFLAQIETLWEPKILSANLDNAFYGVIPNGAGFFLTPKEAKELLIDKNNEEIIFPFLTGKDLNNNSLCAAQRFAINFWDWSLEESKKYSQAFKIIEDRVQPHRATLSVTKPKLFERWWRYEANAKGLYEKIGFGGKCRKTELQKPKSKVLVIARVSSTNSFVFVQSKQIFDSQVIVIASERFDIFAVLQSSIHWIYAWHYGGKMKTDLRYSTKMCFSTFPFPFSLSGPISGLSELGEIVHDSRALLLEEYDFGLTKFNKLVNNSECQIDNIISFRNSLIELDQEVLKLYGWEDILLEHGFYEVGSLSKGRKIKFTISEYARKELLRRLTTLNKQIYKNEVRLGLHKEQRK